MDVGQGRSMRRRYDPIPDEPRHRKKSKRRHVRSDHRHDYEPVCVDMHVTDLARREHRPIHYVIDRCRACGRVGGRSRPVGSVPDGMPLYEVTGIDAWLRIRELGEELRAR